ncbi:MAG: hypothetical protein ACE5KF_02385 [Kiloniellaceae bacterium]
MAATAIQRKIRIVNGTWETRKGFGRNEGLAGALLAILLFSLIQVILVSHGATPVLDGALWDPDSYMWLNRARHLWESGAWFDPVYPRINPPAGLIQHWTRPMDVLLLAGAVPLSLLLGFADGLHWWGAAISPVLLVGSTFALVWSAKPVLPRDWLWLPPLLFVFQPGVVAPFMFGRPDHHSLLILLFILSIGLTLRLLHRPERTDCAVAAGIVAALALWVSIQALPMIVLGFATLGLYWVLGERRLARCLFVYAAALFGALVAALLVERGLSRLHESEFDTLSIAHVILFALNLAFWTGIAVSQRHLELQAGLAGRLGSSLVGAACVGAVMWLAEPGFFQNPMDNGDELYSSVHLAHIRELQPVLNLAAPEAWSWDETVARPLLWLGIAIPALPYLFYLIVTRPGNQRRPWVYFGLLALVFVPLTVAQVRWTPYPEIVLLFCYAALGVAILERLAKRLPGRLIGLARPLLVTVLCLWVYLPTVIPKSAGTVENATNSGPQCPLQPLAAVLSDPAGLGAAPKRMLAFIDFGPELLYRTPHAVLSIPHHRFQPGFSASHRIMTARDFSEAENLLLDHAIDLIVICPGSFEAKVYETPDGGRTFYQALSAGETPASLEPVDLPAGLASTFRVFAVRRAR